MKPFTHEELLELLPAYALNALAPDEAAAVDAALRAGTPESAVMQRELRAFSEVATLMASANPIVPPAAAKERLLARFAAAKHAALPPRPRAPVWLVGALAASLLAASGLGAYALSLKQSLARRETTLNSILEADRDLRVASVTADDTASDAGIQFFWNARQRRGVVHAFRMPPAAPGRAYQVWLLQDGKPVSVSVFNTDADGHALVDQLTLPASSGGATMVLVTEEPSTGSPLPTGQPFMRGELPK